MSDADVIMADRAYFVAFGVEGILWGSHLVIFCLAASVLLANRKRGSMNKFLFTAMTVLFAFCTTHFSLVFTNVYLGVMVKNYSIGTEDNYLLGADFIIFITDFLSQIVLIYRCWLVWQRRWIIVLLPVLMSLTSLACGITTGVLFINIDPHALFAPPIVLRFGEAALGMPLGTNLVLMTLIIGRIWSVSRGVSVLPSKGLQAAMAVVVESGALVVASQLVTCVLFALSSPWQNVAACAAEQCYGIAPTLIILRVAMGNAVDTNKTKVTTQGTKSTKVSFVVRKQFDPELASIGPGSSSIGIDTRVKENF